MFLLSSAVAVVALAAKSQRLSSFVLARANGRDSSRKCLEPRPSGCEQAGLSLQGNKAGYASMARPFRSLKFPMPRSPINR